MGWGVIRLFYRLFLFIRSAKDGGWVRKHLDKNSEKYFQGNFNRNVQKGEGKARKHQEKQFLASEKWNWSWNSLITKKIHYWRGCCGHVCNKIVFKFRVLLNKLFEHSDINYPEGSGKISKANQVQIAWE